MFTHIYCPLAGHVEPCSLQFGSTNGIIKSIMYNHSTLRSNVSLVSFPGKHCVRWVRLPWLHYKYVSYMTDSLDTADIKSYY
uniref:Uncharacterized protein n=1 Tax=Rhizophora mucronata TaxID=61149 RepID=A0A2P2NZR0_RHIMU